MAFFSVNPCVGSKCTSVVDTEHLYTEAGHKIIERFSLLKDEEDKIIDADFKSQLMGRKKHECAELMVNRFRLNLSIQEYIRLSYELEEKLFRECEILPGAELILRTLRDSGIPLGLATGSSGQAFSVKRSTHPDLFSNFLSIVVGDDPEVINGKPAPDIFLAAARRIGGRQCLVVEDSPNGVMAGLAAGMQVAWVPDPCLAVSETFPELVSHPRVSLFESLHDLHERIFKNI